MPKRSSFLANPFLFDLLGLLVIVVFLFCNQPFAGDPGIGWRLKNGQQIVEHGQLPYSDSFLWTSAGEAWISSQWLAESIIWLIYDFGGWDSAVAFCFLLPLVVTIWLQGKILVNLDCERESNTELGSAILALAPLASLALAIMIAWVQWIVRPVIFSFVIFSIVFYLIWQNQRAESHTQARSRSTNQLYFILKLVALFALWANLHPAFPLGIILLGCFLVSELIKKDYSKAKLYFIAVSSCCLATLINPYGYRVHLNILKVIKEPFFLTLNIEWLSPSFSDPAYLPLLLALLIIIFRVGNGRSSPFWIRLCSATFACLALKGMRHVPYLGLILPTLLLQSNNYPQNTKKFFPVISTTVALGVLIFALFRELPGSASYTDALLNNDRMWSDVEASCKRSGGKIFNHPDLGGLITFKLYPACRAFIDDRNELSHVESYKKFFGVSWAEPQYSLEDLPTSYILECSAPLALLARYSQQNLTLLGDYNRFCLLERRPSNSSKSVE